MQKQTSIYIPKPCREDWNKMTATQQGKFCSACNKQVVDFSLMSDNQVLNFLSGQPGKLCGRFDAEQLQRPLVETKIKKKKSWWMALTMPLLFLVDRTEAQIDKVYVNTDSAANMHAIKNSLRLDPLDIEGTPSKRTSVQGNIVGDTIYTVSNNKTVNEILMNRMPTCEPNKNEVVTMGFVSQLRTKTITGKVVDENNNPLAYVTIMQKGTKHGIATDSVGNFSMNVDANVESVVIIALYVGYETKEETVKTVEPNVNIKMKMTAVTMGDVVVVGYAVRHKPVKSIDTAATAIKKFFNSPYKIYPNPIENNSLFNIQIKTAGNYQMQLLDNQSGLMQAEEITVDTNNSTKQIQLSSNIAAGIYYVRLIDEQKKKSYTEKLIVQ